MKVQQRILNKQIALDCLKRLYESHKFKDDDEIMFKEDCRYSLNLLETIIR